MIQYITATFEDGVLKPHKPLQLLAHAHVRVAVEPLEEAEVTMQRHQAWEAIDRLWRQSAVDSEGERLTREQLHERR